LDLSTIVWDSSGTRVLVTNTFLAPDPKGEVSLQSREPCRLASVDLPSMRVRCLFYQSAGALPDPVHIDAVQFGRNADEVWVTMKSNPSESAVRKFQLHDGAWRPETPMPVSEPGLAADASQFGDISQRLSAVVFIKQSLNDPPTLWASDSITGKSHLIWDPNPQLQHVRFGEASVYRWKDRSGRDWIGGLVKPVGYVPGKRYPLVIQMYAFHEDEFLTDGTEPTAFAARELASAGFVVLEVRKKPTVYSQADPETHLEGYRSAVQSLSDAGLIDPHKVGVVGFSFSCWYAINALVNAPKLFAAATIADGIDFSYMQYILYGPGPAMLHEQMDRVRGGSPFGSAQANWFKEAPGFHLNEVEAPVRIEAINPTSVLQEWELYSSLYMQHKPVDLIYFPEGTHVHERPLERYESQQGNVDWLRFWLEDYVDPDPSKRAEYKRWETMKAGAQVVPAVAAQP
jgi:dipeptidyl aminopeptidase/acylaminoacyl peptidase